MLLLCELFNLPCELAADFVLEDCVVAVSQKIEIGSLSASWSFEVERFVESVNEGKVVVLFELVEGEAKLFVLLLG